MPTRFTKKEKPEFVNRMIGVRKRNGKIIVEYRCGLDEADIVFSLIVICFSIVPLKPHYLIIQSVGFQTN